MRRFWLHQANLGMNQLILKKLVGGEAGSEMAPLVLDTYANTSSAGSIIAFHEYHADLKPGDLGVICSFGAGYSIGSVVVTTGTKRMAMSPSVRIISSPASARSTKSSS
jgi:beta-ketodecanoyl-[acyl-carrier-protein] synthase